MTEGTTDRSETPVWGCPEPAVPSRDEPAPDGCADDDPAGTWPERGTRPTSTASVRGRRPSGAHRAHRPSVTLRVLVLLFGAVVGAATLLAVERPEAHAERVRAMGMAETATVVDVDRWVGYRDVVLQYDHRGVAYTVRRGSNDLTPDLRVGSTLAVWVDPQDSSWAVSSVLDPYPGWHTALTAAGFLVGLAVFMAAVPLVTSIIGELMYRRRRARLGRSRRQEALVSQSPPRNWIGRSHPRQRKNG